jgi:sugar transferase (PEP-CTERM/EpsH1 system associated)
MPSERPNILFLVHRVPYPPDKGDRIRTYHLLQFMSGMASVHLACFADEPVSASTREALAQRCERAFVVPLGGGFRWLNALGSLASGRTATEGAFRSQQLRSMVTAWARATRFDVAVASSSSMVQYLRLPALRNVPAVIDLIDVDSQKWFDYANSGRGPRAWLHRLEGRRLQRLERGLPGWARAVTLVSAAEASLYQEFCEPGEVRGIVNGVDFDYFQPRPVPAESGCVFVGALDYRPNVQGATWFCREVWPKVRECLPDLEIQFVGRRPVPAVQRLAAIPGVRVVGQVPDVRPYLAGAAVVVAPLQIARGVQNKVLEGLAMGKAVVASPQALVGLGLDDGQQVLASRSVNDWVSNIRRLIMDGELRRRLGAAGRRFVVAHHDWNRCLAPFGELLTAPRTTNFVPANSDGAGQAQVMESAAR